MNPKKVVTISDRINETITIIISIIIGLSWKILGINSAKDGIRVISDNRNNIIINSDMLSPKILLIFRSFGFVS